MFNLTNSFVYIGIVVVIFVISVALLLFAPKSINFFDLTLLPVIDRLNKDNYNILIETLDDIKDSKEWLAWPDRKFIVGSCYVYPIRIFDKVSKSRKKKCSRITDIFSLFNIESPDDSIIHSYYFIKLSKDSRLLETEYWGDFYNNTISYIQVLKCDDFSHIDTCGIWINGESKQFKEKKSIICDMSKENSIYNNTDEDLYLFVMNVSRPKNIHLGVSKKIYDLEIFDFLSKIE